MTTFPRFSLAESDDCPCEFDICTGLGGPWLFARREGATRRALDIAFIWASFGYDDWTLEIYGRRAYWFVIQGSNDGTIWTEIDRRSGKGALQVCLSGESCNRAHCMIRLHAETYSTKRFEVFG